MADKNVIAELQEENRRLKESVEDLWTINQLARVIGSTMAVNEILDKVVDASIKAIKAEQGTISLLDEKKEDNPFQTLIRKVDVSKSLAEYRLNDHLSNWMLKHRRALMINDVSEDAMLRKLLPVDQHIRSLLSVPLLCKGKLIGVANLFNKRGDGEFTKKDQRLFSIIASQSAQVIETARLYEEEKQLRRVENELEMARNIQAGLLPKTTPEAQRLDIGSYFNPADQVGGDYFDYFNLGDDTIGILMADVSGHGASAGLVMTMIKGIAHAIAHTFKSPDLLLAELNSILNEIGLREMFVTMVFLVFDLEKGRLRFSNAGHNPLLVHNCGAGTCEFVELRGPALGLTNLAEYKEKTIPLVSGDVILIYTDGVTEAFNDKNEMFEEERLLESMKEVVSQKADDIIEHIRSAVVKFVGEAPQSDDMAMIAVKVL